MAAALVDVLVMFNPPESLLLVLQIVGAAVVPSRLPEVELFVPIRTEPPVPDRPTTPPTTSSCASVLIFPVPARYKFAAVSLPNSKPPAPVVVLVVPIISTALAEAAPPIPAFVV